MKRSAPWLVGLGLLVLAVCLFWAVGDGRSGSVHARSPAGSPPIERSLSTGGSGAEAPLSEAEAEARPHSPTSRPAAPAAPEPGAVGPGGGVRPAVPHPAAPRAPLSNPLPPVVEGGHEPPPPPPLTDRIGLDPDLLRSISDELLPLTDECIEDARERDPALEGLLAVEVSIVVDPDVGAIVDAVEFPERNELDDAQLQTCVRETALSMLLPADDDGEQSLMFTIPVEVEG